jgi:hypothetical protein
MSFASGTDYSTPHLLGCADTYLQDPSLPVYCIDASQKFPFADGTLAYVFGEHMIEHISHSAGLHMLRKFLRVLKSHGVLRLSTPDLDFQLDLRSADKSPLQREYSRTHLLSRVLRAHPAPGLRSLNGACTSSQKLRNRQ